MFGPNYFELRDKFLEGKIHTYPGHTKAYPDKSFGPITIADVQLVYSKTTKTSGVLTHIGSDKIAMECSVSNTYVEGPYEEFLLADAQGQPLADVVYDVVGNPIAVGSVISFAAPAGRHSFDVFLGLVTGFNKVGGVKVKYFEYNYKLTDRVARHGPVCSVHPDTNEKVIAFRKRIADAEA